MASQKTVSKFKKILIFSDRDSAKLAISAKESPVRKQEYVVDHLSETQPRAMAMISWARCCQQAHPDGRPADSTSL